MQHPLLLNDVFFKMVFGNQKNELVLRSLINAVLDLQGNARISRVDVLNPDLEKDYLTQKGSVLDIRAVDGGGRCFNIEVQVEDQPAYENRIVYYSARLLTGQIDRGDSYESLRPTINISLLDFARFPQIEDLHTCFTLWDPRHGVELTRIIEIHLLELSKLRKSPPESLENPLQRWLHFLKFGELYECTGAELPAALRNEEGISMALDAMNHARASDQVRELVEQRRRARLNWNTIERHAIETGTRIGREQGLEEGLEQGRALGLEQGLEQGREQGLERGKREASLQLARKLLERGIDLETVLETTGLSPEQLAAG